MFKKLSELNILLLIIIVLLTIALLFELCKTEEKTICSTKELNDCKMLNFSLESEILMLNTELKKYKTNKY